MAFKVKLQASRRLTEGEDSKRYEFSFTVAGELPKFIADCLHPHRGYTLSVDGYVYRPCPLREKTGAPRFMCSAPMECTWRGEPTVVATACCSAYQSTGEGPSERLCPRCGRVAAWTPATDRFQRVDLEICPTCEWAGRPVVGTEEDRARVLDGFMHQLLREDFSSFEELRDEDRDIKRWVMFWGTVKIEQGED